MKMKRRLKDRPRSSALNPVSFSKVIRHVFGSVSWGHCVYPWTLMVMIWGQTWFVFVTFPRNSADRSLIESDWIYWSWFKIECVCIVMSFSVCVWSLKKLNTVYKYTDKYINSSLVFLTPFFLLKCHDPPMLDALDVGL